jgi:NAD-dependent DNA ligase
MQNNPEIEKIIEQAINDYYNTDKPLLTDNTFDILENILLEKKPNSKVFEYGMTHLDKHDLAVV